MRFYYFYTENIRGTGSTYTVSRKALRQGTTWVPVPVGTWVPVGRRECNIKMARQKAAYE